MLKVIIIVIDLLQMRIAEHLLLLTTTNSTVTPRVEKHQRHERHEGEHQDHKLRHYIQHSEIN